MRYLNELAANPSWALALVVWFVLWAIGSWLIELTTEDRGVSREGTHAD